MPLIILQTENNKKGRGNPAHSGAQSRLARFFNCSPNKVSDYVAGRKDAGLIWATKFGEATKTSPLLWGPGGDPEARKAAVEAWGIENPDATSPSCRAPALSDMGCRGWREFHFIPARSTARRWLPGKILHRSKL